MMNITNVNQEYQIAIPLWRKCRVCREGEEAVHAEGVTFLPKLGDQTESGYEAYKKRAQFFNAFAKTISSHTGLVLRNEIIIQIPDNFQVVADSIDRIGSSIPNYIKKVLDNILTVGRHGTLIDYPKVDAGSTLQDAQDSRPYWVSYRAEDILDWEYTDGVLVYALIREHLTKKDNFYQMTEKLIRYRMLTLENGVYSQQVYIEGQVSGTIEPVENAIIPLLDGKPLNAIPFMIHQPNFDIHVDKPPLLDLVNTNLAHYRTTADYFHGLHYVALPTPYIIGVDPEDKNNPSSIGPEKLWLIENESASVGMLEFSGSGLGAIKNALDELKTDMATLGARMLMNELTEKTATAAKIKSISETSDLASIVTVLNTQFNDLLKVTIAWFGDSPADSNLSISKSFLPPDIDAQMLLALVRGWQEGAYDYPTLVNNLQNGEIIDPNIDASDMAANVDSETEERTVLEAQAIATAQQDNATIETGV
jgi:hypothetical protein